MLRHYKLFAKFSRGEAIFRYLEIVQSLPMYSYHYFEVKVTTLFNSISIIISSLISHRIRTTLHYG